MSVGMIAEASEETEEIGATTDTTISGMEDQEGMVIGMEAKTEANIGEGVVEEEADSTNFRLQCQSTRATKGPDGVKSV